MSKRKLILCTLGTSIARDAETLVALKREPWDASDSLPAAMRLRAGIKNRIEAQDRSSLRAFSKICAELSPLAFMGLAPGDKVYLLASDGLPGRICAEAVASCLVKVFGLDESDVRIKRVQGLQAENPELLRKEGLKHFVSETLAVLGDANLKYSFDIIFNPTAGFKFEIAFMAALGMLFGVRSVYFFEQSDCLINLPPLPIAFDLDLFRRVRPALDFLEQEVAVAERDYFAKIPGYAKEDGEDELFLSFTEHFDDSGKVTLSPLADCLLRLDPPNATCRVSPRVLKAIEEAPSAAAEQLRFLLDRATTPLGRQLCIHRWCGSNWLILRQHRTSERLAGFIQGGEFHAVLTYSNHDDYERDLRNRSIDDYRSVATEIWRARPPEGKDENA